MNLAPIVVRYFIIVALIQPNQISELFIVHVKEYNSETVITILHKNGACRNGDKYYPDIWPFIQVTQMIQHDINNSQVFYNTNGCNCYSESSTWVNQNSRSHHGQILW